MSENKKSAFDRIDAALKRQSLSITRFTQLLEQNGEARTRALRKDIELMRTKLRELGDEIQKAHWVLNNQQQALNRWIEAVVALKKKKSDFCVDELRKLVAIDRVLAFEVKDESLFVFTDFVVIKHNKSSYRIAMYEFEYILSSPGSYRIKALITTNTSGSIHPNGIGSKEGVCMGNLEESIRQALGRFEFCVATEFLFQGLVTTTNPDRLGTYEKIS